MSARGWILAIAGAAVVGTAGALTVRAAGTRELPGSRLPARLERPDLRLRWGRLADQVADLASQAGEFVRIVSTESAAKEAELRARLGLDDPR